MGVPQQEVDQGNKVSLLQELGRIRRPHHKVCHQTQFVGCAQTTGVRSRSNSRRVGLPIITWMYSKTCKCVSPNSENRVDIFVIFSQNETVNVLDKNKEQLGRMPTQSHRQAMIERPK